MLVQSLGRSAGVEDGWRADLDGGDPDATRAAMLARTFARAGRVRDVRVVENSAKPRAFVDFDEAAAADAALAMSGAEVGGRTVRVERAAPRPRARDAEEASEEEVSTGRRLGEGVACERTVAHLRGGERADDATGGAPGALLRPDSSSSSSAVVRMLGDAPVTLLSFTYIPPPLTPASALSS